MAAPVLAGADIQPRNVADLLDGMAKASQDVDREIAAILCSACDALHKLAWNRYAARVTRQSERQRFQRHHKALMAVRAR